MFLEEKQQDDVSTGNGLYRIPIVEVLTKIRVRL